MIKLIMTEKDCSKSWIENGQRIKDIFSGHLILWQVFILTQAEELESWVILIHLLDDWAPEEGKAGGSSASSESVSDDTLAYEQR